MYVVRIIAYKNFQYEISLGEIFGMHYAVDPPQTPIIYSLGCCGHDIFE